MMTPNVVAYIALIVWAPIALFLYTRVRAPLATMIVLLGASLFLPLRVAFDAPFLPALGRESISVLCALFGCLLFVPRRLRSRIPGTGVDFFLVLLVLGAFITAFGNGDAVSWGPVRLPGMQ